MTERQSRWAFHICVLVIATGIHSVGWWMWQGSRGKLAELPGWLQHVAGVGTGAMIGYTLLPLLVLIMSQARAVLRPRVLKHLTKKEWGHGIAALLKVGLLVGIFGVWMPWIFWAG